MTAATSKRASGDLRPDVSPPKLADPSTEKGRPSPWDWSALSDTEAAYQAEALASFVTFFNHRYAWSKDQIIPPCWSHHGALVEEITTLMWCRWAAFEGPRADTEAAQTWHTYHLPLFIARVTKWIGPEGVADCRAGRHQPSRLMAPAAGAPPEKEAKGSCP